jgi:hypothetical protein
MTHRMALLASLMLLAAAQCGAQSPASDKATSPTSSATPSSSTASSSATAPATAPAPAPAPAPATATAATDSAAAATKPAGSDTAASSEPSPEVIKEARREGFKPKKRNGVTTFCQTYTPMGTRFESENCVDEVHLRMVIEQRQAQRDLLRQQGACTGASCNGH